MPPLQNLSDFSLLPIIRATIPIHTNVRDLVAVSRSLTNVFFHLVLGQIPPSILLCWGYWDPYLKRRGERLETKVLMDDWF